VSSAVAEKFSREKGIDFAGVVLVATFSSLPTMLAGYSLGGVVPLLKPLSVCPPVLRFFLRFVVDKWKTLDRLAAVTAQTRERNGRLRVSIIHAADDRDIPCVESVKIFEAMARASVGDGMDDSIFRETKNARTEVTGEKAFKIMWNENDITSKFFHPGRSPSGSFRQLSLTLVPLFHTPNVIPSMTGSLSLSVHKGCWTTHVDNSQSRMNNSHSEVSDPSINYRC
jgi:hypothetical protein